MKKSNLAYWSLFVFVLGIVLISCSKDEDEDRPNSSEVINFVSPDSTTIFADSGAVVDFNLYIAADEAIDTVRAAYSIDTSAYLVDTNSSVYQLTFLNADTVFFAQGFADTSNVQSVMGSLTLPLVPYPNDTTARYFKPYFAGSTSPYIAPSYDAVKVVFKVETVSNKSYEKQMTIIIN